MRRMITTKQAETLDNVVYNPQTNTTEIGGHLYVDGEIISGMPTDISVFGELGVTSYTKEQLIEIALKYNHNGFAYYNAIGKLHYLDPNAEYQEGMPEASRIFVIEAIMNAYWNDDHFSASEYPSTMWTLVAYYTGENEITLEFAEL